MVTAEASCSVGGGIGGTADDVEQRLFLPLTHPEAGGRAGGRQMCRQTVIDSFPSAIANGVALLQILATRSKSQNGIVIKNTPLLSPPRCHDQLRMTARRPKAKRTGAVAGEIKIVSYMKMNSLEKNPLVENLESEMSRTHRSLPNELHPHDKRIAIATVTVPGG